MKIFLFSSPRINRIEFLRDRHLLDTVIFCVSVSIKISCFNDAYNIYFRIAKVRILWETIVYGMCNECNVSYCRRPPPPWHDDCRVSPTIDRLLNNFVRSSLPHVAHFSYWLYVHLKKPSRFRCVCFPSLFPVSLSLSLSLSYSLCRSGTASFGTGWRTVWSLDSFITIQCNPDRNRGSRPFLSLYLTIFFLYVQSTRHIRENQSRIEKKWLKNKILMCQD